MTDSSPASDQTPRDGHSSTFTLEEQSGAEIGASDSAATLTSTEAAYVDRGESPPSHQSTEGADPRRWWALIVIATAQLMVVLDASIVTIALPHAAKALDISKANSEWVITAYTLAFGSLLLLGGRIADFMGRKRMLIIGLLGFALASAIGGMAQNAAMLLAARAVQGAMAAIMAPAALALITVTFVEAAERAKAFAIYGATAASGAAIGVMAGGVLTQYASWRWCLYVNTPISIAAAILAVGLVRESRAEGSTRYDLPGVITATAGLAAAVYGFSQASTHGWGSGSTLFYLAAAAVLLTVFLVIENRSSHALLPIKIIVDRNRGASFISSLLVGMGMLALFIFLTYYFQSTLGYSALRAGFAFLPFSVSVICGATITSRILPKLGPRTPMAAGFATATAGVAMFTLVGGPGTNYWIYIFPAEVIMAIGLGMGFVALSSTALVGVQPRDSGVASATLNATQQVGGSIGVALLNTIAATAAAGYANPRIAAAERSLARIASPAAQAKLHETVGDIQLNSAVHGYRVGFICGAVAIGAASTASFLMVRATKEHLAQQPAAEGIVI